MSVRSNSPDLTREMLERATLEVKKLRAQNKSLKEARTEPIAIIGMGCRFPGSVDDPGAFWRLLEDGVDAVREIPPDRWSADLFSPDQSDVRWAGLLDAVDGFDAAFFGIAPREAQSLDPQQRLVLEVAWEALEHAGQVRERFEGSRAGVFIGACNLDYRDHVAAMRMDELDVYSSTGTMASTVAGRASYFLGLQGPCMTVDTACSSSLVALHLACQSLRDGESDMALAGGVNLLLSPVTMQMLAQLQALSPDGRCRSFDARANGFVRAEGCGIVVLKRLSDAQRSGDRIWALIRGSAVNQDGRSTGLTAPNVLSQCNLLRQALEAARVSPSEISYVEAHGTGTSLGDPIEVEALKEVLGKPRADESSCALGSVKTNLGHLEAAAGIAGLIKVVLALQHETIPRQLHFTQLNPRISLADTPFVIAAEDIPWKRSTSPRIAGVSSFGISGTNAHVIVQEAPPQPEAPSDAMESAERPVLLPISAHSPDALRGAAQAYRALLKEDGSGASLQDIAYTASLRRSHHGFRLALVGASRGEMVAALDAFASGAAHAAYSVGQRERGERLPLAFVFSGQGAQWHGMGQRLLEQEPLFRQALEECDAVFRHSVTWSLIDELRADPGTSRLGQTDVAQPAIFAIQMGLVALLRHYGIVPDKVVGHSVGEIAAACAAGALTLEEASSVVFHRSRLMHRVAGLGRMYSVASPPEEVEALLADAGDRISIAAINAPRSVVLSGDAAALAALVQQLSARGVACRDLRVDYAFHSPQMDRFQEELAAALVHLRPKKAHIGMYSTVTGQAVNGPELNGSYWARNLRDPVRFAPAIEAMLSAGCGVFVEVAPHAVLSASLREIAADQGHDAAVIPTLRRNQDESVAALSAVGALYSQSQPVDLTKLHPRGGRLVSLPRYSWQRERYWVEAHRGSPGARRSSPGKGSSLGGSSTDASHPFLCRHLRGVDPASAAYWEADLSLARFPYLRGHQIGGAVVLPATGYIEMILAAAEELFGAQGFELSDTRFLKALFLEEEEERTVKVCLAPVRSGAANVSIYSRPAASPEEDWSLHVTGRIQRISSGDVRAMRDAEDLTAVRDRLPELLAPSDFYGRLGAAGVQYGPDFQAVRSLRHDRREFLGEVALSEGPSSEAARYLFHPALFDAALQITASLLALDEDKTRRPSPFMPLDIARIVVLRRPGARVLSHVTVNQRPTDACARIVAGARIFDEAGHLVADVQGVNLQLLEYQEGLLSSDDAADWLYEIAWESAASLEEPAAGGGGTWLVVDPSDAMGAVRKPWLGKERTIHVKQGAAFAKLTADEYTIRPHHAEDYAALLRAVRADAGDHLRGVLYLAALADGAVDVMAAGDVEAASERACAGLLHLLHELSGVAWKATPKLWIATSGSQRVRDGDLVPGLAGAPLWGLAQTIASEHAAFMGGIVDLDPGDNADQRWAALGRLIRLAGAEQLLAVRGGAVYVARLARRSRSAASTNLHLRAGSTYLITGGLGALGLRVARWLVQHGARHLMLLGRTGLPDRAQWSAALATGLEGERIAAVLEIERLGASVQVIAADVTSEAALRRVVEEHERSCRPPIAGVVHAAGVAQPSALAETDAAALRAQLGPKVQGTWAMHRIFKDQPLDFFVLFSSVSTLLQSPFLGAYAAANSFLDAFAHHRRSRGMPALSINWGAWSGGGMGSRHVQDAESNGIGVIRPEQGLEILGRLLSDGSAQVGVLPVRWREWFERHAEAGSSPLLAKMRDKIGPLAGKDDSAAAAAQRFRAELSAGDVQQRKRMMKDFLARQIGAVLRLDAEQISADQPFGRMGVDSLMSTELRASLEATLGVMLSVTMFWNYPTLRALVDHLLERMELLERTPVAPRAPASPQGAVMAFSAKFDEELPQMSEEQAEYLLMEQLRALGT